jgi:hypothetical protein
MNSNASFIEELLRRVPDLKPIYEEHLLDNETLLPHVFMGGVTRFTVTEAGNPLMRSSVTGLLDHLENELRIGGDSVKELICVSFVENLLGESTALQVLTPLMGPMLKTEVERTCV